VTFEIAGVHLVHVVLKELSICADVGRLTHGHDLVAECLPQAEHLLLLHLLGLFQETFEVLNKINVLNELVKDGAEVLRAVISYLTHVAENDVYISIVADSNSLVQG
jgi:hypothetical protein